jgi:hypothetical protein
MRFFYLFRGLNEDFSLIFLSGAFVKNHSASHLQCIIFVRAAHSKQKRETKLICNAFSDGGKQQAHTLFGHKTIHREWVVIEARI